MYPELIKNNLLQLYGQQFILVHGDTNEINVNMYTLIWIAVCLLLICKIGIEKKSVIFDIYITSTSSIYIDIVLYGKLCIKDY